MQTLKRWFKPHRLYDINYGDRILRSIVKTTYAKKSISSILLMLLTVIARLHIDAICGAIFNFNNIYIDFWVQIFISIILVIKSGWIYQMVEKFDREVYSLTRYLINNYSEDNYRRWKRNITFLVCIYLSIYFSVVEITSYVLRIYILQYVICYIIIEIIERKYYGEVFHIFNTKIGIFTYGDDDFELISDRKSQINGIQFSNYVKKTKEKSNEEENKTSKNTKNNNVFILTDNFTFNKLVVGKAFHHGKQHISITNTNEGDPPLIKGGYVGLKPTQNEGDPPLIKGGYVGVNPTQNEGDPPLIKGGYVGLNPTQNEEHIALDDKWTKIPQKMTNILH